VRSPARQNLIAVPNERSEMNHGLISFNLAGSKKLAEISGNRNQPEAKGKAETLRVRIKGAILQERPRDVNSN